MGGFRTIKIFKVSVTPETKQENKKGKEKDGERGKKGKRVGSFAKFAPSVPAPTPSARDGPTGPSPHPRSRFAAHGSLSSPLPHPSSSPSGEFVCPGPGCLGHVHPAGWDGDPSSHMVYDHHTNRARGPISPSHPIPDCFPHCPIPGCPAHVGCAGRLLCLCWEQLTQLPLAMCGLSTLWSGFHPNYPHIWQFWQQSMPMSCPWRTKPWRDILPSPPVLPRVMFPW